MGIGRKGDHGTQVSELQRLLLQRGYAAAVNMDKLLGYGHVP